MTFRQSFMVLGTILLLTGCQSADSSLSAVDKTQPTPTKQHLLRDNITKEVQATGNFSVSIFPSLLTSSDNATAVLGNCSNATYKWYINNNYAPEITNTVLSNDYFERNNTIKVIAKCGSLLAEDDAIIQNSPPEISAVKFLSPIIISGQDLTVIPIAQDHDGDSIYFRYEWVINGLLIEEITEPILPAHFVKKGAQITLGVTPYDDFSDGATFQGSSFYIGNTPPSITSQPPPLTSSPYNYHVNANDPDNDKLFYHLTQNPVGMVIDKNTGLLTWQVDKNTTVGTYEIGIMVEDQEGLFASQHFTLSLSKPE